MIASFINNLNGKTVEISSWEVSIGRAKTCDIILSNPTVSRFHAVVARRGKGWMIFDTNSKSGVFVNGQKIEKSAFIYDGDEISMGTVSLSFVSPLFRADGAAQEPAQPAPKKKPAPASTQKKTPADATKKPPAAKPKPQTGEKASPAGGAAKRRTAATRTGSGKYISALRNTSDRSLILLFANEYTVGRAAGCSIQLPIMTVSRQHAKIARRDGRWTVADLGSKSGTLVNGSAEKGVTYLYDGDKIDVGGVVFKFIEKYMEE